jgi:hypothetical protein
VHTRVRMPSEESRGELVKQHQPTTLARVRCQPTRCWPMRAHVRHEQLGQSRCARSLISKGGFAARRNCGATSSRSACSRREGWMKEVGGGGGGLRVVRYDCLVYGHG